MADSAPDKIIVHNLKASELRVGDEVVGITPVDNPYRSDGTRRIPIFTVKRDLDSEVAALLAGAVIS